MEYRALGRSGIKVSKLGFGCWGLGGDSYGPVDTRAAIRTLHAAQDAGVNFFDTSDSYGTGSSEFLLGEAFLSRRDKVLIASKFGNLPHRGFVMPQDFSVKHLELALRGSLYRLKTDYLDLYQLHSPPGTLAQLEDLIAALQNLIKKGCIRAYGISARSPADALQFIRMVELHSLQINFNLIDQRILDGDLLPECKERGVGIIARTPLCFGYLTGKLSGSEDFGPLDHRSNWPAAQRRLWATAPALFCELQDETFKTLPMIALAYCTSFNEVSCVIPGMMTPQEVEENVGVANLDSLPPHKLARAREIYQSHSFFDPGAKSPGSTTNQAAPLSGLLPEEKEELFGLCKALQAPATIVEVRTAFGMNAGELAEAAGGMPGVEIFTIATISSSPSKKLLPGGNPQDTADPPARQAEKWFQERGASIDLLLINDTPSFKFLFDTICSWCALLRPGRTAVLFGDDNLAQGCTAQLAGRICGEALRATGRFTDMRRISRLLAGRISSQRENVLSLSDCVRAAAGIQKEVKDFIRTLEQLDMQEAWKILAMRARPFSVHQACYGLEFLLDRDFRFMEKHCEAPREFRRHAETLRTFESCLPGDRHLLRDSFNPATIEEMDVLIACEQTRLTLLMEVLRATVLWIS